jgi:hypothetical protein
VLRICKHVWFAKGYYIKNTKHVLWSFLHLHHTGSFATLTGKHVRTHPARVPGTGAHHAQRID